MSGDPNALIEHLKTGLTTVCRAWALTRKDGTVLGFTDHDRDLTFDGIVFRAGGGMTARAVESGNGLAVDNSEAQGVLNHSSIRAEDIHAGRFDGAKIQIWEVNWADVASRRMIFRGTIGEITETGRAFEAELRGLADALNQPQGRVFQKNCDAILGDKACKLDLNLPGYFVEIGLLGTREDRVFSVPPLEGFDHGWFERGRAVVLDGQAAGLTGVIKFDSWYEDRREFELWQSLRAPLAAGDRVRLEAGCDKRAETCRLKFHNFLNFQGFPNLPGEDWLMSYPAQGGIHDGGRR